MKTPSQGHLSAPRSSASSLVGPWSERSTRHPLRESVRVLWIDVDESLILATDDGSLKRYIPATGELLGLARPRVSIAKRLIAQHRLGARFLRQAARTALVTHRGTLLWVASGALWRKPHNGETIQCVRRFSEGHGPLFLAQTPTGQIYWADYIALRVPRPTGVYVSEDDGASWQEIHRFAPTEIRHSHGAFWDETTQSVWLTSGDAPHESALWRLDQGRPVQVAGGTSLFRIVQPVFTPTHVLFGTDVPGRDCYLHAWDRKTGEVTNLAATPGPVFFGTRVGDWAAFTTVVEPLHPCRGAALFVGRISTMDFREVLLLPKDRWHMRLFQYGQIHLPQNTGAGSKLWLTPCATSHDGALFSLTLI